MNFLQAFYSPDACLAARRALEPGRGKGLHEYLAAMGKVN
jgi:hypothetical protein